MDAVIRDLYGRGLTKSFRDVLQWQTIDAESPGPILANVQSLMDAIGDGMATKSKYFALPQSDLNDLNIRMAEPLSHRLKRPQLRSFPQLMGLFVLLRACGLAVGESKPKRVVLIDPEMLEQWNARLNATERYMSLLQAWLTTASWESVGEDRRSDRGMSIEVSCVYRELAETITKLGENRDGWFGRTCNAVTLSLLHEFGWVRLTREESVEDGKAARIRSIERLPLGDAMFAVTTGMSSFPDCVSKSLRETLQPFFREWERSLVLPEPEYRDGEFTLKLSCGKVWRRLIAPADTTLDALANALLNAFQFDHDHLYEFEFRNRVGIRSRVACPMMYEGDMFADEMRLGDLPLDEGESLTMVYDFGDDWHFNIKIEQIGDSPSRRKGPKVIKLSGTAPKQYDFDPWDD